MDDIFSFFSPTYSLSTCPCVVLAKICSYLGSKETLTFIPSLSKSLNQQIRQDSQFFKALNSGSQGDNFIVNQRFMNKLEIDGNELYRMFRLLKINYDKSIGREIKLTPLDSSSKDYNQSVHRTVNRHDQNQFWSSGGSTTPEADEWLTYKIPLASDSQNDGLKGYALIRKFVIKIFDPSYMQNVTHKYAPKQIQILIGNSENSYHFKSQIYNIDQESTTEQTFSVDQELCTGRFIKVNLLDKPHKQPMDDQYYCAVSYFGIEGISFDQLVLSESNFLSHENKPEEQKSGVISKLAKIAEKSANLGKNQLKFQEKFQTLLIQSNNQYEENDTIIISNSSQLQQLNTENVTQEFAETLNSLAKEDKPKYLFQCREQILENLQEYVSEKVLKIESLVLLFNYSLKVMGISGDVVTKIMIKYMQINPFHQQRVLHDLRRNIQDAGSVFVDLPAQDLENLTKNPRVFSNGLISQILQSLNFLEEFCKFELLENQDTLYNNQDKAMRIIISVIIQKMQKYEFINYERLLRFFFQKYDYGAENLDFVKNWLKNAGFPEIPQLQEAIEKIQNEIEAKTTENIGA